MVKRQRLILIVVLCAALAACSVTRYFKGGLYRELDENLTIVGMISDPERYLDKEIVFSVRFYKKGTLPCPLGKDYVNFKIADRVSYIMLDKVWIKKEESGVLDSFQEMDTIIMKAKVFKVDKEKDPNLLALKIVPE
jgi:hypothetical protein